MYGCSVWFKQINSLFYDDELHSFSTTVFTQLKHYVVYTGKNTNAKEIKYRVVPKHTV